MCATQGLEPLGFSLRFSVSVHERQRFRFSVLFQAKNTGSVPVQFWFSVRVLVSLCHENTVVTYLNGAGCSATRRGIKQRECIQRCADNDAASCRILSGDIQVHQQFSTEDCVKIKK